MATLGERHGNDHPRNRVTRDSVEHLARACHGNTVGSDDALTTIELTPLRRLARSVVLGQAAISVVAALLSWALGGRHAALTALLGGGISTCATAVKALVVCGRRRAMDAVQALVALFVGEAAKLAVVVALFVVVWRLIKVAPAAMLAAYAATFLVYWIVLARELPVFNATRRTHGGHDLGADSVSLREMR